MLRNDSIIPRLSAGAGDDVTKMCAMQVVSWQNGDTKITSFPECSARPLARLVQSLNDRLAGVDGFLSPENSLIVLDLGWQTVGTADTPRVAIWRWLAALLVDPDWGVVKCANPAGVVVIRRVAKLCMRAASGDAPTAAEWQEARAVSFVAASFAAAAADAASASASASASAAVAASADAAYAVACAASTSASADAAYAVAVAAAAVVVAVAAVGGGGCRIEFTRWAIQHWRDLAGLDNPTNIDPTAVDSALTRIHA